MAQRSFVPCFGVMNNLLALFGAYSVQSLLIALGETKLLMKLNLISISIGIPIGLVLVPLFGVIGVIIGVETASVPVSFICLYFA